MKEDTREKFQEAGKKAGAAAESLVIAAAAGMEELSRESVKAAKKAKEVYDERYADRVEPYRKAAANALKDGAAAADAKIRSFVQENELDKKAADGMKDLKERLFRLFEDQR